MVETKLPGSSNCIEIGTVLGAHYFTFLTTVGDGKITLFTFISVEDGKSRF